MGRCRLCKTEIKPHQTYCPNCGAKLPLLNKEEIKDFKRFKKKFKTVFAIALIIILVFFTALTIKVPVTKTISYNVEEKLPELKPGEELLKCREEDFRYSLTYEKPQVFANVLKLSYNIKNLEGEQGIFEYTIRVIHKLSLEEKRENSELLLEPYESKTITTFFKDVKSPNEVEYSCEIIPPKSKVCEVKTERVIIIRESETTRTKIERVYKSLFEIIFLKD